MYLGLISVIAKKVGVSASLLLSICTVETGLRNVNNLEDPNGGSYGVCQVSLPAARSVMPYIGILALQQPEVNIEVAALYLKKLQQKYDDNIWHSVAAYNAGTPRMVDGVYRNQKYVDKVQKVYYGLAYDI
jgi:soluble lytic murein transglycosylase-like protein